MKKPLFTVALCIVALVSCQKEEIVPASPAAAAKPQSAEKEMGNTKEWGSCFIYDQRGKPLYEGKICKGKGNECGRKAICTIPGHLAGDPAEVVFEDLTSGEFVDLWNTEEGMNYLLSKGVYVVEE